jgi:hypothetical protein
VVWTSAIMFSAIMLIADVMGFIILVVVMLNVIRLSVVMLIVLAPFKFHSSFLRFYASIQASFLLVSFQLASPAEAAQW